MNGKLIRQAAVVTTLAFAGTVLLAQSIIGGKAVGEAIAEAIKAKA